MVGLIFVFSILLINNRKNHNFNKPTLIMIFHDGDFNGTGVDFKTDGTFVFDNSAMGFSNYMYGRYNISGNKITMNVENLDNVIKTKYLEIQPRTIENMDGNETENYVFQVDEAGIVLIGETDFRVIVDNRR